MIDFSWLAFLHFFPVSCSGDILSELPDEINRFLLWCVMFTWVLSLQVPSSGLSWVTLSYTHTRTQTQRKRRRTLSPTSPNTNNPHKKRKKINGKVNQSSIYINANLKILICKSQNVLSRTTAKSFSPGVSQDKMLVWADSIL